MLDHACFSNCLILQHSAGYSTGFLNSQVLLYEAQKTKIQFKKMKEVNRQY